MTDTVWPADIDSDEGLLDRVVAHDRVAFARLYDRYAHSVYVTAVHVLGHADAEEAVQEIFVKLWLNAAKFDAGRGAFRTWFNALARNQLLDLRKRRTYKERHLRQVELVDEMLVSSAKAPESVPDEVWRRELREQVRVALQDLPAEQRRVILMAYFGGYTQSAIAGQLGWPLGTVKKRIRLGLQKLRRAMQPANDAAPSWED